MLNIGLIDVDGHNFPNLALMKISAHHKCRGDKVEFATMFEHYDILYKSKVFTFTPDNEYCYNADKVIQGGTGYDYSITLTEEIDSMTPDYGLYNCEHAYGFLTRGCPNKCSWCIVPKKEGNIKPYADIQDIMGGSMKSAILMDNNILASDHGIKQIEKIIDLKIKVDFNQGLDARLIDGAIARLLRQVKWIRYIRMACDSQQQIPYIKKAVKLLRIDNKREIFVYMLVKDVQEALERAEYLRSLNVTPFAQAYRDFENNAPPTREQQRFCRWVNHKAIFKTVSYSDYK
jgi:hypothetical protein